MADLTRFNNNDAVREGSALVFKFKNNPVQGMTVTSGQTYDIGKIPAGTIITQGYFVNEEAFDSAGSASLTIGIEGSPTYFTSGANLKSSTNTIGVVTAAANKFFATETTVKAVPTISGVPTTGTGTLVLCTMSLKEKTGKFTH